MSDNTNYFEKQRKRGTAAKMQIVVEYFKAWATVMKRHRRDMTYLDLFSGRGSFEDGEPATPLKILDAISEDAELCYSVKTYFYEEKSVYYKELKSSIEQHSAYKKLRYKPIVSRDIIANDIITSLPSFPATFCFVDPFGYKGMSIRLLSSVTSKWGCDCQFYFSTSGVGRNIESKAQKENLIDLFGEDGFKKLESEWKKGVRRGKFEDLMLQVLKESLVSLGVNYFIPFKVFQEKIDRTSHHLIFVSKHALGFKFMKDIMEQVSELDVDGIAQFICKGIVSQQILPVNPLSMQSLRDKMTRDFAGATLSRKELLKTCHENKYMYTEKSMRKLIQMMIADGTVREVRQGRSKKLEFK